MSKYFVSELVPSNLSSKFSSLTKTLFLPIGNSWYVNPLKFLVKRFPLVISIGEANGYFSFRLGAFYSVLEPLIIEIIFFFASKLFFGVISYCEPDLLELIIILTFLAEAGSFLRILLTRFII